MTFDKQSNDARRCPSNARRIKLEST